MRAIAVPLLVTIGLVPGIAPAQQANSNNARLIVGVADPPGVGPHTVTTCPGYAGPSTVIHIGSQSPTAADAPIILAVSSMTQPGALILPSGTQFLDVALPGLEVWSALLPGILNSFFRLTGQVFQIGYIPNPATPVAAIQGLVYDPASAPPADGGFMTAAFEILPATMTPLALGDDATIEVPLGWTFHFFGAGYTSVWVCSNGRLTFGAGSIDWAESTGLLRSGPPSVNLFWDDLDPGAAGQVLVCNDTASRRFRCQFAGVPEYLAAGGNNASAILAQGGNVMLVWGACSLLDCIAGIHPGNGVDMVSTSLNLGACALLPCLAPVNRGLWEVFGGAVSPFDLGNSSIQFVPSMSPANAYFTM